MRTRGHAAPRSTGRGDASAIERTRPTARAAAAARALRGTYAEVASKAPDEMATAARPVRVLRNVQAVLAAGAMEANRRVVERTGPHPAVWPTDGWSWSARLERSTDAIRDEYLRFAEGRTLPHTAELAGFDPDSERGRSGVPIGRGRWRTLPLHIGGRWVDAATEHFPVTCELVRQVPGAASVGFSVLEPHSGHRPHRDPNDGALRYQLPLIVPDSDRCGMRVEGEVCTWIEGRALAFDVTAEHETWNDCDEARVLFLMEVPMPMRWPASWVCRFGLWAYRWYPHQRSMHRRANAFAAQPAEPAPA